MLLKNEKGKGKVVLLGMGFMGTFLHRNGK